MYWAWTGAGGLLVHSGGDAADAFIGEIGLDGVPVEPSVAGSGGFRTPAVTADGAFRGYVAPGGRTAGPGRRRDPRRIRAPRGRCRWRGRDRLQPDDDRPRVHRARRTGPRGHRYRSGRSASCRRRAAMSGSCWPDPSSRSSGRPTDGPSPRSRSASHRTTTSPRLGRDRQAGARAIGCAGTRRRPPSRLRGRGHRLDPSPGGASSWPISSPPSSSPTSTSTP